MTVGVVGIRLEAPMQAWALAARGYYRDCHARPTKSGVIGLVANALGRDFADSIDDLATLRFGVRVDRPGVLETDFHTTGGGSDKDIMSVSHQALSREWVLAAGKGMGWMGDKDADPADPRWLKYQTVNAVEGDTDWNMRAKGNGTQITVDRYLADASFLAALEGDPELISAISDALVTPARAVFLGRKACGPATELLEDVREATIEELFADTLDEAVIRAAAKASVFDAYVEPRPGTTGYVICDQPVSFNGPIRRTARFENHYTLTAERDGVGDGADRGDVFDSVFAERA